METITALAVTLTIGVLIGVFAMSKRPIITNVTQNVNHTVNVSSGGGVVRSIAGAIFPVLAFGGMALVAVAAVSSVINANQQVTDTAARSIEAQRQIVQAIPQPQIVVQPQPVTVNQPPVDLTPLVNVIAVVGVGALAVFVVTDITSTLIRQRRQDRQYAQAQRSTPRRLPHSQPLTHPLFDQANQKVSKK